MRTLSLKFSEEGWERAQEDKDKPVTEVTKLVIINVVQAYSAQKQGLSEGDRRLLYKVVDALEDAIKEEKDTVELEDAEFGFVKKAFNEVRLAPSVLLRRVEELIQEVQYR